MSVSTHTLHDLASRQHGVFSLQQAVAHGVPSSTVHNRMRSGYYSMLGAGVYAVAGAPSTWQQDATALVLSVPGLAAASHKTAAYLWDMASREPERAEIVTARHRRVRRRFPEVHESLDLRPRDVVPVDGIPTTSPVRTIVDLGASASPSFVERCLDTGLRTQLFSIPDVERYIRRVARSGRNGIGTIRPLVEERIGWVGLTESALEDLFRRVISPSGLPQPVPQFRLMDGQEEVLRSDFAYPERYMLIELDSEGFHMDRATFQADREKQNRAHALGWTVYRFTWRQLQDEPGNVISILAAALARE